MLRILAVASSPRQDHLAVRQCLALGRAVEVAITLLTIAGHRREKAQAIVVQQEGAALLRQDMLETETLLRFGQVAAETVRELEQGHYDLAILEDEPSRSLVTRLLGPTAERVIGQTACPVLVAREPIEPPQSLLLCDSGVQTPRLVDRFIARFESLIGSAPEIAVLHVMSQMSAGPGVDGQQLRATAADMIEADTPEGNVLAYDLMKLQAAGALARPKIRHGLVVEEILTELDSGCYDMVVIGSHRQEGWERFLLEDLAHEIIARADRPILIMP